MSVDIDWSLLSAPFEGPSLSDSLIVALNKAFNQASRPSFMGPVTVTSFDFGEVGPDIELKDVRDVWRAFDEGDDEGDAILEAIENEERRSQFDFETPYSPPLSVHSVHSGHAPNHQPGLGHHGRSASLSLGGPKSALNGYSMGSSPGFPGHGAGLAGAAALASGPFGRRPRMTRAAPSAPVMMAHRHVVHGDPEDIDELVDLRADEDTGSVHSGLFSGRHSVASVGIGLARHRPFLSVPGTPPRYPAPSYLGMSKPVIAPMAAHVPPSTPSSPPARPAGLPEQRPNPLPSVQIHLHLQHAADISLTLLTSLQVNYPSQLFMSLPLKLVITGMTLSTDAVVAYSGAKHRMYVTLVDSEEQPSPAGQPVWASIGQRILPELHIESEIGSADMHVLRNVGKVERFIVDVVRKTLVNELVFPNFQTIALA